MIDDNTPENIEEIVEENKQSAFSKEDKADKIVVENKQSAFSTEAEDELSSSGEQVEDAFSTEEIPEEIEGIKISNDVVATYAGIAVSEVKGVYGKGGTFSGITEALSGKKNLTKGIKVDVDEKSARIDVNIIVIYGARIPDVAFEIQSRVKTTVENMTGLMVSEVNVNVLGVQPADKEDDGNNFEEDI